MRFPHYEIGARNALAERHAGREIDGSPLEIPGPYDGVDVLSAAAAFMERPAGEFEPASVSDRIMCHVRQ